MAIVDARDLPDRHEIVCDLCIVGSGAAGLALASEFLDGPTRVAVLESGGFEPEAEVQALCEGDMVGVQDYPLGGTRLRLWGGTTNHWTAWLHPLRTIDLEPRPWVPYSGWPVSAADLTSWYGPAIGFFGLPADGFDPTRAKTQQQRPWPFAPELVTNRTFQIPPEERRRLGPLFRSRIAASRHVDAYLHATVLSVETNEAATQVTGLRATSDGRVRSVRARRYVIAAGGIENARLLLLSNETRPAGLGNDHDLVGRFFANHLSSVGAAELHATSRDLRLASFRPTSFDGVQVGGYVQLREQVQREHALLNCNFSVVALGQRHEVARSEQDFRAWVTAVDHLDAPGDPGSAPGASAPVRGLMAIAEPRPNPASRVRLGEKRDRLGQRRVALDWQLSDEDARSVEASFEVLARAAGAGGVGRLRLLFPENGFRFRDVRGSYHHMGTTRMHVDPKHGVVNPDCRVHGIENLFIAGSSVFPTFGTANPTLTIVALALRLADHLKGSPA